MAYVNAMGLTTEQFIQLEQLKVWRETCKTNTCIFAANGQTVPLAMPTSVQRVQAVQAAVKQ